MSGTRPARRLHLVDDNGEVVPSAKLTELQAALEKAREDLKLAERDLVSKRRQLAEKERDKARERLDHPQRELIKRIAVYWHRKCRPEDYARPRRRINPITPERFDAVAGIVEREEIVREEGKRSQRAWKFEFEHFKAAIDGEAFDPFLPPMKNGKANPQNDLEQIFRTEARFEMAMKKCPYEVVPVLPARLSPKEVAERGVTRDTPSQVPISVRGPAGVGRSEGSNESSYPLGGRVGREPLRVEARGLLVRARLEAGAAPESAA